MESIIINHLLKNIIAKDNIGIDELFKRYRKSLYIYERIRDFEKRRKKLLKKKY